MRTISRLLAFVLLAPGAYLALAGQTSNDNAHIDIGKSDDWKNYDSMPIEKSGEFKTTAMSLMICPMMMLKDKQPDTKFHAYIDVDDDGHAMLTAAPIRDESDIEWVVTSDGANGGEIHVELHAADDTSSSVVSDVWRLLKHCESR